MWLDKEHIDFYSLHEKLEATHVDWASALEVQCKGNRKLTGNEIVEDSSS